MIQDGLFAVNIYYCFEIIAPNQFYSWRQLVLIRVWPIQAVQLAKSPTSLQRPSLNSPTLKRSPALMASDNEDSNNWEFDDSDVDGARPDGSRKRNKHDSESRPMSVSCETCKQRKVKCDRGQPTCGWCLKNGQQCDYRERKKPGLRAGYGRELESKLSEQAAVLSKFPILC